MPFLSKNFILDRCPHCSVASPNLEQRDKLITENHDASLQRLWVLYVCSTCGGIVSAWGLHGPNPNNIPAIDWYPTTSDVDEDIPERPRVYLKQARESLHAPSGAVMLTASAVDAMLKIKGLTEGTLYTRIEKAIASHLITDDMGKWAHEVRLDANDERHAELPSEQDAKRVIDFAIALAEIMFVLPARVVRGIGATTS